MFSLKKRFSALEETVKTYPIATSALLVLAVLILLLIWNGSGVVLSDEATRIISKILIVGFVFVAASASLTKRLGGNNNKALLRQGGLLLCAVIYYLILPGDMDSGATTILIRHGMIQAVAVLSLLVVPLWITARREDAVYKGLLQLLQHASLAFIFSMILAGGIAGALAGIEALFSVTVASEWYPSLFAVIGVVFGGVSFLDGIRQRDTADSHPIAKEKWQTLLGWVVGILLLIYGLILYTYLGKILFTWERPSNQVTRLGFAFSGFVVAGSILLVPLIEDKDKVLTRQRLLNGMYLSLIPILGMICFAIHTRIVQYGMTEMRYLVCLLIVWLLGSAVYMIVSKRKDLWWIVAGLFLLAVVGIVGGPVSASGLARSSQYNRMVSFMEDQKLTNEGGILDAKLVAELSDTDKSSLGGTVRYLVDYHGPSAVAPYIVTSEESGHVVAKNFGLPAWGGMRGQNNRTYIGTERAETGSPLIISGYTTLYADISLYGEDVTLDNGTVLELNGNSIDIWSDGKIVRVDVGTALQEYADGAVPLIKKDGWGLHMKHIHGYKENESVVVEGASFDLLQE